MREIEILGNRLLQQIWAIDEYDINLSNSGWVFKFNKRKTALGTCDFLKKTISLSKVLVDINNDNIKIWDDTIRHEIAHAIDYEKRGTSDHSEIWKNIAIQVGCSTEVSADINQIFAPSGKYTLKCKTCGIEKTAHRKLKKVGACGKCCTEHNGGLYNEKYILDIIVNF